MLDFYGHIDQETAHMSALRTLLAHNKGVKHVRLAGLAGALALGDLLHSTITHQRPSLEQGVGVRDIPNVAQFVGGGLSGGGGSFPIRASSLPNSKHALKLLDTLVLARVVTAALDYYVHDQPKNTASTATTTSTTNPSRSRSPATHLLPVTMQSLTHARNAIHHALISLPAANGLWGVQYALYDVSRISALIYSDLVLFPLPAETGVRGRYAALLRAAMDCVTLHAGWREEGLLLLWGCVLGGVAAAKVTTSVTAKDDGGPADCGLRTGIREREWFIRKTRMCAEMLGVGLDKGVEEGWEEVKTKVCTRYLWWAKVCDPVGKGVWEEVVALEETREWEDMDDDEEEE
jgi:hypothetical protein